MSGITKVDAKDADIQHQSVLFSGTLPLPSTNIARIFERTDQETQERQSEEFFSFLTDENSDLKDLNNVTDSFTTLVNIPNTSKVKLLHSISVGGSSSLVKKSKIDGQFVFLYEDGNESVAPNTVVLPTSIRTLRSMASMTLKQFSATLSEKGPDYEFPLVTRGNVLDENRAELMQIAPIPAYLVYDGVDKDLDAAEIVERVLNVTDHGNSDMYTHLLNFLLACLSSHNADENKPHVEDCDLIRPDTSMDARQWGRKMFEKCFPTLMSAQRLTEGAIQEPPAKRRRVLNNTVMNSGQSVSLGIDSETLLNPQGVENLQYYCRDGISELFHELVDDQTERRLDFNINVIGPPGVGKSNLVFAAAEHIAFTKKQNVLWVGQRTLKEPFSVKLFQKADDSGNPAVLIRYDTDAFIADRSSPLRKIFHLATAKNVEVLIVDSPTQAENGFDDLLGTRAFEWTGKLERKGKRRVIHVSSLVGFSNWRVVREQFNVREMVVRLWTREDYIKSLSNSELKKQVCKTLNIDPDTISTEDVVDMKFWFSGINARWFYNKSIEEIKEECNVIVQQLGSYQDIDEGQKRALAAPAVWRIKGVYVYTSCYLARLIVERGDATTGGF